MSLDPSIWLICVLTGTCAGMLSTYLGLGGGVLFVVLLPTFFGFTQAQSIGTSLMAVFLITMTNVFSFHKQNLVRWNVVFVMVPASMIMAFFAGEVAQTLSEVYLVGTLVVTLLSLGVWTLFKKLSNDDDVALPVPKWKWPVIGGTSGAVSGLTGIGAGAINSTFLFNWRLVKSTEMSPTSNAIMMFTTLGAIISFFDGEWKMPFFGMVNLPVAGVLYGSALITARLGQKNQHNFPRKWRKRALVSLFFVLSVKEIIRITGLY